MLLLPVRTIRSRPLRHSLVHNDSLCMDGELWTDPNSSSSKKKEEKKRGGVRETKTDRERETEIKRRCMNARDVDRDRDRDNSVHS